MKNYNLPPDLGFTGVEQTFARGAAQGGKPRGCKTDEADLAVVIKRLHASLDYRFVQNPAYNRDRGPVSVLGLRLHAQS